MTKAQAKTWSKIILNSHISWNPPISLIPMEYDENKVLQITLEGQKNIKKMNEVLKEHSLPIYASNTDIMI